MKIGKITQLTHGLLGAPDAPLASVGAHATVTPQMLLARIVRLEQRLTDVALRLYALETAVNEAAKTTALIKPKKGGR